MMKALLLALLISTPALAVEPAGSPGDIIDSCMKYELFVMSGKNNVTGEARYITFSCKFMFTSDKPPIEAKKAAPETLTMM
jgi:hypothetical protein